MNQTKTTRHPPAKATKHGSLVLLPHVNPAPQHREMWLRDPDGYVVVIASPDGEAKGS
jgi:hypothetical protein